MSHATGFLATLFENRYNFLAPDSGPHQLPYTCSFHWFHTADGQLIGVDVVRSDDMGRRALRVFAIGPGGDIASLILEGPSSDWAPFATDNPPTLPQDKPVLGRGRKLAGGFCFCLRSVHQYCGIRIGIQGPGSGQRNRRMRPCAGSHDGHGLLEDGGVRLDQPQPQTDRVGSRDRIRFHAFWGLPAELRRNCERASPESSWCRHSRERHGFR